MESRIENIERLVSHGNVPGRKAMLEILETGLQATDPYHNTRKLIHLEGNKLTVGVKEFEPAGDPHSGKAVYDLSRIDNIYIFGAGKGIHRYLICHWPNCIPGAWPSQRVGERKYH